MKKKTFVAFTNPYASMFSNDERVVEYLDSQLEGDWTCDDSQVTSLPTELQAGFADMSFIEGFSSYQLLKAREGGTFINHMYAAISLNEEGWRNVFQEEGFEAFYLEVPFEVMEPVFKEKNYEVPEDVYESGNNKVREMVDRLLVPSGTTTIH